MLTCSRAQSAASRCSGRGRRSQPSLPVSPLNTTWRTLMGKSQAKAWRWGTYPMARRSMRWPCQVIVPVLGTSPRMARSSVVLPAPLGPISPMNWPWSSFKLTSCSTLRPPSCTLSWFTSSMVTFLMAVLLARWWCWWRRLPQSARWWWPGRFYRPHR